MIVCAFFCVDYFGDFSVGSLRFLALVLRWLNPFFSFNVCAFLRWLCGGFSVDCLEFLRWLFGGFSVGCLGFLALVVWGFVPVPIPIPSLTVYLSLSLSFCCARRDEYKVLYKVLYDNKASHS